MVSWSTALSWDTLSHCKAQLIIHLFDLTCPLFSLMPFILNCLSIVSPDCSDIRPTLSTCSYIRIAPSWRHYSPDLSTKIRLSYQPLNGSQWSGGLLPMKASNSMWTDSCPWCITAFTSNIYQVCHQSFKICCSSHKQRSVIGSFMRNIPWFVFMAWRRLHSNCWYFWHCESLR